MKKLLIFIVSLLVLVTGCSHNTAGKSQELKIIDSVTTMGGSAGQQELTFQFTINTLGHSVKEDSLELVLSDWTNERLIDKKISEIKYNHSNIFVKGYVMFESNGVSKQEIEDQQPLIKGFNLQDEKGKEIFLKYEK